MQQEVLHLFNCGYCQSYQKGIICHFFSLKESLWSWFQSTESEVYPSFLNGESCTLQWENDSETVSFIFISPTEEFLLNINNS